MKSGLKKTALIWFLLILVGWGCGPFFPDTVLNRPRAALDVPPVSYLENLYQLAGSPLPTKQGGGGKGDDSGFLSQIPREVAELCEVWQQQDVSAAEVDTRTQLYEEVRTKQLAPIVGAEVMAFHFREGVVWELPARPLGEDFPREVADYVEAARLYANGEKEAARELWQAILDRPLEDKKLRSVWAAWMLAKTAADRAECFSWYERVEQEAATGGTDVIGLRGAAKAWRAANLKDPIASLHFYYEAFQEGKVEAAIDIRNFTQKIWFSKDRELLAKAAADPLVRKLVNLDLQSIFDGPQYDAIEVNGDELEAGGEQLWLAALQQSDAETIDDAARIGWVLYSTGKYAEAGKWLALADANEPLAQWLQAKFDLRKGDLEAASRHLSAAVKLESAKAAWNPQNPRYETGSWYGDAAGILAARQVGCLRTRGLFRWHARTISAPWSCCVRAVSGKTLRISQSA